MKSVKEIQEIYQEYQNQLLELWCGKNTDFDALIRMCRTSAREIERVYLYPSRRNHNTRFARTIGEYLANEIKDEQFRAEKVQRRWAVE